MNTNTKTIVIIIRQYKGRNQPNTRFSVDLFIDDKCYDNFIVGHYGYGSQGLQDCFEKIYNEAILPVQDGEYERLMLNSPHTYCDKMGYNLHVRKIWVGKSRDLKERMDWL